MPIAQLDNTVMQNAAVANGNGANLNVGGYGTALLNIVSSVAMSGGTTVNFEASCDGTNWVALSAHNVATGTITTTTTADGCYRLNVLGFQLLRARISGYSAGTTTINGFSASDASSHFATALAGSASAASAVAQVAGSVVYNGTSYATAQAFTNLAASQTNKSLVTATASRIILVLAVFAQCDTTSTNLTFQTSTAHAAISPIFRNSANGGEVLSWNPGGWFATTSGDALEITSGAGSTTSVLVTYAKVA